MVSVGPPAATPTGGKSEGGKAKGPSVKGRACIHKPMVPPSLNRCRFTLTRMPTHPLPLTRAHGPDTWKTALRFLRSPFPQRSICRRTFRGFPAAPALCGRPFRFNLRLKGLLYRDEAYHAAGRFVNNTECISIVFQSGTIYRYMSAGMGTVSHLSVATGSFLQRTAGRTASYPNRFRIPSIQSSTARCFSLRT